MIDCELNDKRYIVRLQRRVQDVKKKVKPKLTREVNGWQKFNYAETFDLSRDDIHENIIRIDKNLVSADDFHERYEKTSTPVIIMNDQKNWLAHKKWKLSRLKIKYRNQEMKCGEDNDGRTVKLKMKYYVDYMMNNSDDSPLYVFDGNLNANTKKSQLLEDYVKSDYFNEDLFGVLEEKERPPYRWFVMGPARSGSGIHIDPLGTSAWNALVKGYKRWCFFPPCTPKYLIKPDISGKWGNRSEAIIWFDVWHKRVSQSDWPTKYAMIEAIQKPGETIFIPSGWWHVVINLTNTVAITQNFCSTINFPIVWYKTAKARKNLSKLWYQKLLEIRPDLCEIMNKNDLRESFRNYYSSSSTSSISSSSSSSVPKSSSLSSSSSKISPQTENQESSFETVNSTADIYISE